ncbi:GAF domain-containing protein, partial [Anaerolineae bacterium CFX9]|nr:GAF domain-containing protein [Anaerolineae bacterium CFX9]
PPDSPLRAREGTVVQLRAETPGSSLTQIALARGANFMAVFPLFSGTQPIALFFITSPEPSDLSDEDYEVYRALTGQMSTVLQNRQLFRAAETERERLRLVLETLPAGVLVLDPVTLRPTQANLQAEKLLGDMLDYEQPFDIARYRMYRTGTDQLYPESEMPIYVSARSRVSASADDIAILMPDGVFETNLLVNAAPITDSEGAVTAIVAAFQDITPLRSLENTLQQNLRETIALYETTRALAEAEEADDVLDQVLSQVAVDNPADAQVLLLDEEYGGAKRVRSLNEAGSEFAVPDEILTFGEAQFVDDLEMTSLIDEVTKGKFRATGIQAYVSIPLRARARRDVPMGWLVILFDQPQPDMAEREQFLNTLADSASVALDNRQLFRSTQIALQETASLYGATTAIAQARNIDQLTNAVSNALESLQPDMYAAYLRDASGELRELFNHSLDSAPLPLHDWVTEYRLLSDVRTIFVDDLRQLDAPTDFESALLQHGTVRSIGVVQLRAQNKAAGLLVVAYHTPHRFSSGDARYLSAIAESTSVVADNILLLSQIQNTLQETSALYQASRRLSNAEDNHGILDAVIRHLTGRPLDLAFITLLNAPDWQLDGAVARVAASWQSEPNRPDMEGMTLRQGEFPAWRLLAADSILMIDDVAADPRLSEEEREGLESISVRSLAVLPLRVASRVIGALFFGSRTPYQHTERDQRVYMAFAEQASLRMEATRLLAQTERRARQLATSADVSQIASSILDINELMPRIVETIKDAFRYDHVQIFLMDMDDNYAELRASTGEAGQKLLSIKHKLQKGSASVIGTVTKTGKPTIVLDTEAADVIHRPNPYLPNTRSEMAVPLILKGRVIGALDVQSNTPQAFDDDDVAILTTLAGQIATAIDNAQLFEQSQRRANEMTFLFDVTTAAASAETLNDALQNVAQELRDSLDALSVSLYLPAEYIDAEENVVTLLRPVALAGVNQPLSELSEINLNDIGNLIAIAAHDRQPVRLNNVELETRYLPVTEGAKSAIIVPLSAGSNLVGLIAAESDRPAAYDQGTMTLLLTLSGTLSAIVQNQSLLEQVQKTNEQLRELDRLKSDFLANMSHELRTPLNSIIGFSRVILKGIDGPLTEMQEQDLSTIYNSGVHLLGLINDILDQAKIAAGKMDLQFDYFEMRQVIDGVRSIGIGLVKEKPIDIVVDIAPGLPRAYGDEFRTRQVLLNLISNAAKFTREGSITIRAYTQKNEEGKTMVRVDVTDTGIGIAEPDIPLLFEAFRQVDSSLTRTAGGTGLGLPIAKSLIEMQSGEMLVESKVNVGSTFSILIPVEPAEGRKPQTDELSDSSPLATGTMQAVSAESANGKDQEDTHIIPSPQQSAPDSRQRVTTEIKMARPPMHVKRQILLIEDNPDMVDQFRRSLQREGFDIFSASIPLEAEAMASGLHPTLIIMDVNFGSGTGWDILERLRQRDDTVDIPIIIVTLSQEQARGEALGVFRWIQRPFAPETLVKAVQDAEEASRVERILIIDDDAESIRLLRELLDLGGGYRIFSAQNGMEGIAMVARRRPHLVIVDLRMPEMDGFAVIRELRNNPETATIPILVVTGDTALTPAELEQLRSFRVLYKAEISAEQYRPLIDGVRNHLQHPNQVMGE